MNNSGSNQDSNKIHNRSLILKLIKQHPGVTRTDLAQYSNLSKPAITKIVQEFTESGVIGELEDKKIRNKGLVFAKGRFYTISIYLGRLAVTGALFDLEGSLVTEMHLPQGVRFYGNDELPENALELIHMIIDSSGIQMDSILAVGIAAPGSVEIKKGLVFNRSLSSCDPGTQVPFNWGKIHLVEFLKEKTNLPIFIDNNSNLSALAESWFGKGVGVSNFVQYSVGIGIGGGAIIENRLFRGNDNIVCEIGHVTVDCEGERCFCGNTGCLETVAGFGKIVDAYEGSKHTCNEEELQQKLKKIFMRAEEGDAHALMVLKKHASKLGIGAVTLINMFSPEKLILSINDLEGISLSILIKEVEAYVKAYAYPIISDNVQVELSDFGANIHLYGAYALILENLFILIQEGHVRRVSR